MSKFWPYILIALFSMVPTFEGRYAIVTGLTVWNTEIITTFIIATLFGFLPSPFIIILIEKVLVAFRNSKFKLLKKFGDWLYNKIERAKHKINKVDQTQLIQELENSDSRRDRFKAKRLKKRSDRDGFGIWTYIALTIFVSIPLPGTGVWTGAMAAGMLNMRLKEALPPIFIGNIIASLIMTFSTIGLLPHLF